MKALPAPLSPALTNNMNQVRLILAFCVFIPHSYFLSGNEPSLPLWIDDSLDLSNMAVNGFFLLSGYLITASWERSASTADFILRRFLRIYPAYFAAMMVSAGIAWSFCPEFRARVIPADWLALFGRDLVLLKHTSLSYPGIFISNPFPKEANGSLWTIHREALCYLLTVGLGWFAFIKHRQLLFALFIVSYAWHVRNKMLWGGDLSDLMFARFGLYFLCGACLWRFKDKIPPRPSLAACALAFCALAFFIKPVSFLMPIPFGFLLIYIGLKKPWPLLGWCSKKDISYGLYLFAFPLQQLAAMLPLGRTPWGNIVLALPPTLVLAGLSWRYIEKPAMALRDHPIAQTPILWFNAKIGRLRTLLPV